MVSGLKIAQQAKERLTELTGLKPDTVSGFTKDEEGWHVTVEMIEMKRIPEAMDVLASYKVLLNEAGDVIGYQRIRRYRRGDIMEEGQEGSHG